MFLFFLENDYKYAKEFLMESFPQFYQPQFKIKHTSRRTKGIRQFDEEYEWQLPFGDECKGLNNLPDSELTMRFHEIRKKLKELKHIFVVYSRCHSTSRNSNKYSDVRL